MLSVHQWFDLQFGGSATELTKQSFETATKGADARVHHSLNIEKA